MEKSQYLLDLHNGSASGLHPESEGSIPSLSTYAPVVEWQTLSFQKRVANTVVSVRI